LTLVSDGNIAILISYSGKEVSDDFRRLYALAELRLSESCFTLLRLDSVPYQTASPFLRTFFFSECVLQTSQPGPPVHPRIQLMYGGSIISVQFGDAVALCARGSHF